MNRQQMEHLARTNIDAACRSRDQLIVSALNLKLLSEEAADAVLKAPWARDTENRVCDCCGTLSAEFLPAWCCELLLLARVIDETMRDKYRETMCACANG